MDFFYPLNSLNRVIICAGTPYSAPRDLIKKVCVIVRFSCYSMKKNIFQCTKLWLLTKIGKLAYEAVLIIVRIKSHNLLHMDLAINAHCLCIDV